MVWEVTAAEMDGSRVLATEVEPRVAPSASGTKEEAVGWRGKSGRERDSVDVQFTVITYLEWLPVIFLRCSVSKWL